MGLFRSVARGQWEWSRCSRPVARPVRTAVANLKVIIFVLLNVLINALNWFKYVILHCADARGVLVWWNRERGCFVFTVRLNIKQVQRSATEQHSQGFLRIIVDFSYCLPVNNII